MRDVTENYLAQVKSCARQFGFRVDVYGNSAEEPDTLLLSDIISIDITRSASDQLQIGACMSSKLTLQTRATTLLNGRGKKVVVYYRCTAPLLGWDKLGTFYVDECVTEQGITAVTAYDMMSRLDKRVSWVDTSHATAPTFPCTMQAMLNYICARAGVTTDFTCQNITVDKTPDGYTARELISYIAASHGGNAYFSANEILKIRTYEQTSEVIQYGECYSMEAASDSGYTVKGILFDRGGDDKIYIDGTSSEYDEDADGVVQAFNPFATVGIAEYAWSKLGGLSCSAVSIEMPAVNILEPGDVFTIQSSDGTEKTAIVMEQSFSVSCTGGFVETISCSAESKNQTRNAENRAEAMEKASKQSGSSISGYEYLSDTSVKFNGTTYTVEKDSATGLISKISDSYNHEFKPTLNSGIADVALHNAVFWAVAMCRGLVSPTRIMLYDSGNEYQSITGGWELNIVTGGSYFADCVASSKSDGVLYGKLTATSSVPTNKKMGNVSFTTANQISLAGYSKVCASGEWFIELANSGARNCDLILTLFANEPTPDTPASAVSAKYRRRTEDNEFGVIRHTTYEFDVSDLDSSHYISVNTWGTTWLGDTTVASTNAYFKVSKIWLEK